MNPFEYFRALDSIIKLCESCRENEINLDALPAFYASAEEIGIECPGIFSVIDRAKALTDKLGASS